MPLAVVALDDRVTQLAALELLGELGGPEQAIAVAGARPPCAPPADVPAVAVRLLSRGPAARVSQLQNAASWSAPSLRFTA